MTGSIKHVERDVVVEALVPGLIEIGYFVLKKGVPQQKRAFLRN